MTDNVRDVLEHPFKNSGLSPAEIEVLEVAGCDVEEIGQLSKKTEDILREHFCRDGPILHSASPINEYLIRMDGAALDLEFSDNEREDSFVTQSPERNKREVLPIIGREKESLMELMDVQVRKLDARSDSLALPTYETSNKILRYETTLERQMYRAMSELERLQRRRLGDVVSPPTMKVQI